MKLARGAGRTRPGNAYRLGRIRGVVSLGDRVRAIRQRTRRERPGLAWTRAMAAGKATATTLAILVFVAGLTLDDLHLFRVPALYVGAALAVLVFAFAPPLVASRLLRHARADEPDADHVAASLEHAVTYRRIGLGFTVLLFVAWLVLFSSGRTPRW